jgi:hypothetical protein
LSNAKEEKENNNSDRAVTLPKENNITTTLQKNSSSAYSHFLQFKLEDKLFRDYQLFKEEHCIKHDSDLLRAFIRIGIVVMPWLQSRGRFELSSPKLKRILADLTFEEKAELLQILEKEFPV